jgi:hypothetical protein
MAITSRDKLGRIKRFHDILDGICPCGKMFSTTQDRVDIGRGKFCSKKCMYKYRTPPPIKKDAKYSAVHKWIAKKYGQDMTCERCNKKSSNPYEIHWANLDGNYDRLRENWARLCAKCHWHYDREGIW